MVYKKFSRLSNAYRGDVDIIVTGLLPGKGQPVKKVQRINNQLRDIFMGRRATDIRAFFKKPDINEWCDVLHDGSSIPKSSVSCGGDGIHLNDASYKRSLHSTDKLNEFILGNKIVTWNIT